MSSDPEADARSLLDAYHAALRENPNLVPYIGPQNTLERFLAGAVVGKRDMVTDQSPFTIQGVLPEQLRRLKWMMER